MDRNRQFYFLEMNTRLQVEHPVTEMVTGLDFVKEQIRVALGQKLSFTQSDIVMKGAAIECRSYAEDPENNFFPSPGTIQMLRTPSGPGVRDDSGVYEGWTVPIDYDPLISKLLACGTQPGHRRDGSHEDAERDQISHPGKNSKTRGHRRRHRPLRRTDRNRAMTSIDEYLAKLPREQRIALKKLRKAIHAAAPGAVECISYQMPAFKLDGKMLVYFAAWANHCAFYPGPYPLEVHKEDLRNYDCSKGTLRFPSDKPLPATLVRKLVKTRIAQRKTASGRKPGTKP